MLPGIGVFLADGDHSPVDADKFFSTEIIHIFKVYDIGAVDPVKGFRRELLLQVRDISIKFNGRPGLHMDLDDPVLYLEKNNVRQEDRANGLSKFICKFFLPPLFSQGNGL